MIKEGKCLEYYLDSRQNGVEEIQQKIKEIQKEFPKKLLNTNISVNDFGMYVITIDFKNKEKYWNKLKEKRKNRKTLLLKETNNVNKKSNEKYGEYKATGTFKPY